MNPSYTDAWIRKGITLHNDKEYYEAEVCLNEAVRLSPCLLYTSSDAALRQVAGQYAYDDNEHDTNELTFRGGGEEINDQLERQLNERLAMAGMEIVEARICLLYTSV